MLIGALSIWRRASRLNRVFAGIGLVASALMLSTLLLPQYRSQTLPVLVSSAMLSSLSIGLLLAGHRVVQAPSAPSRPPREVNEAVMPIPGEAVKTTAIGREAE